VRIEWSQHLFSDWVDRFPFATEAPYRPSTNHLPRFPVQTYLDSLQERGIDMGIIVQPEPYGEDHRLLLYSLALEQQRLLATCLFLPADPQAPEKMEQMAMAEDRIIAQRFHAFRGRKPYFGSWMDEAVQKLWHMAVRLGLIIEIHISPEQASGVQAALEANPDTPVVIDHLGEPGLGSDEEFARLLELARYPQVILKLSALDRIGQEIGQERLGSCLQRAVEAFGAQRLVWGGGTLQRLAELLSYLSEDERALITGGNLQRILGIKDLNG